MPRTVMTIFRRCNVAVNYSSETHLNVLLKGFNPILMFVALKDVCAAQWYEAKCIFQMSKYSMGISALLFR